MKVKASRVVLVFTCSILCSCAGMGHIGYRCEGQPKSAVLQKFGPPERVIKSIENAETWEYTMGGGVKTYTFLGDKCVKENSRSQN